MNKRVLLFLIMLFLIIPLVFSITTFTIRETEKISLQTDAADPDADRLSITYSAPLNSQGEWQTEYGDAGQYKITITVSDGIVDVSEDVLIIVTKKEEAPAIESFNPQQDNLVINEAESVHFEASASDLNKDELSYEWLLDGKRVNQGKRYSYETGYNDAGTHIISVAISDGNSTITRKWGVNVLNVNVEGLLNEIKDVNINENEVAKLELPDFKKYGLAYSVSEPLGSKNEWQTNYKDSGAYLIKVHAEGKGFASDKIVNVVVKDINRVPVFDKIKSIKASEGDQIAILLNAYDEDEDEMSYSIDNSLEGYSLKGNAFLWTPSYSLAGKKEIKKLDLVFVASDGKTQTRQIVKAEISNKNRPPRIINATRSVVAKPRQPALMFVKAVDEDEDALTYTWKFGFFEKYKATAMHQRFFSSKGAKTVKVTVSDGIDKAVQIITVNVV